MMLLKFPIGNSCGLGLNMEFETIEEVEEFLQRVRSFCNAEEVTLIIKTPNKVYGAVLREEFQIWQIK